MSELRIPSRYFRHAHRSDVQFICLHTTEGRSSAQALANAWQRENSPHVSAHWIIDDVDEAQCVSESDCAYAAGPSGNRLGIHIEIVGFTLPLTERGTGHVLAMPTDWSEHPTQINLVSRRVLDIAKRWSLPLEYVDSAGLVAGAKGITIHEQISLAWHETDHVDGKTLPIEQILSTAIAVRAGVDI